VGYIETSFEGLELELAQQDKSVFGRNGVSKRLLDITISSVALVFLLPLFGLVALLIKSTSKGPVFYRQERLGLGGKTFSILKFRSMHIDGDHKLTTLLEKCAISQARWEKYQKLEHDPRITRIGHFLRKSSIDELPQLINVLMGTMSIVGQRPLLPHQALPYGQDAYRHYKRSRPGITGLWQVSGRNALPFEKRVELDKTYSENWSLAYDIKLMFKTIPVLLFPSGAF